jgi:DNA-binding IclR family transcriptional regulator
LADRTRQTRRRPNELHEHHRYLVLRQIHEHCGSDSRAIAAGPELVRETGLSPAELYRIVEYLAWIGYVNYLGAGPRVRISREGREYVLQGRGRRETVRDLHRAAEEDAG